LDTNNTVYFFLDNEDERYDSTLLSSQGSTLSCQPIDPLINIGNSLDCIKRVKIKLFLIFANFTFFARIK